MFCCFNTVNLSKGKKDFQFFKEFWIEIQPPEAALLNCWEILKIFDCSIAQGRDTDKEYRFQDRAKLSIPVHFYSILVCWIMLLWLPEAFLINRVFLSIAFSEVQQKNFHYSLQLLQKFH